MTDIAIAGTGELVDTNDYVALHKTGLTFREDTPYEVWAAVYTRLAEAADSVQWWIGDALNFGERTYGQTYSQVADATGLGVEAVKHMKWVAEHVKSCTRVHDLSWSHHRAVAALDQESQEQWLQRAVEGKVLPSGERVRWSKRDLEDAIATEQRMQALGVPAPVGTNRCIVIDPPWPMEKIERDVRPAQGQLLDYPVMTLDELTALPVPALAADHKCVMTRGQPLHRPSIVQSHIHRSAAALRRYARLFSAFLSPTTESRTGEEEEYSSRLYTDADMSLLVVITQELDRGLTCKEILAALERGELLVDGVVPTKRVTTSSAPASPLANSDQIDVAPSGSQEAEALSILQTVATTNQSIVALNQSIADTIRALTSTP